jgi:hypothetical protein
MGNLTTVLSRSITQAGRLSPNPALQHTCSAGEGDFAMGSSRIPEMCHTEPDRAVQYLPDPIIRLFRLSNLYRPEISQSRPDINLEHEKFRA